MATHQIKLEESFLQKALDGGVPLRLILADRERLSGTLSFIGRYDIRFESEGRSLTLPKKEVFQVSPSQQLLDEKFFESPAADEPAAGKTKVQDEFLDRYVGEKTLALLKMTNGEELRGVVEGYDGFTISVRTGRGQTLIYKHGLCSIGPGYRRGTGKEDARQRA
jgi:RNA chaperone Hfq